MNTTPWTKEAYEAHAMAFVADYVRLYALYHEGGIYMDTDVWMKKSFDYVTFGNQKCTFRVRSKKKGCEPIGGFQNSRFILGEG